MIKDVLTALDYSAWAEFALVIFAGVFVAVCVRTLRSSRSTNDAHANLVFDSSAKGQDDV